MFVYTNALANAARQALEADLGAKFGVAVPVYTSISGAVTLADGVTPVAVRRG